MAIEANLLVTHSHLDIALSYAIGSVIGGIIASMLGIQITAEWHRIRDGRQL